MSIFLAILFFVLFTFALASAMGSAIKASEHEALWRMERDRARALLKTAHRLTRVAARQGMRIDQLEKELSQRPPDESSDPADWWKK